MSILVPNSHILYREIHPIDRHQYQQQLCCVVGGGGGGGGGGNNGTFPFQMKSSGFGFDSRKDEWKKNSMKEFRVEAFWPDSSRPTTAAVEIQSIEDCDQFDKILEDAQRLSQPIIIEWMATWCRKCIYLKPKLEKLAAEYDTKLKFYCVDVNKVPQNLVKRGNITKMPTIQLWKDGEMKAEVIGGHKAWLVIEEVRAMIIKFV